MTNDEQRLRQIIDIARDGLLEIKGIPRDIRFRVPGAEYEQQCPVCNRWIFLGDPIVLTNDEQPVWVHEECASANRS